MSGDPRGHDHGGAEEVAPLFDRLARVQADANMYRFLIRLGTRPVVQFLECPLQRDRALYGAGRRCEGSHEPVSHRLDLRAAVYAQDVPRQILVLAQHVAAGFVAEPVHHRRVLHHIREQDRADPRLLAAPFAPGPFGGSSFRPQQVADRADQLR